MPPPWALIVLNDLAAEQPPRRLSKDFPVLRDKRTRIFDPIGLSQRQTVARCLFQLRIGAGAGPTPRQLRPGPPLILWCGLIMRISIAAFVLNMMLPSRLSIV